MKNLKSSFLRTFMLVFITLACTGFGTIQAFSEVRQDNYPVAYAWYQQMQEKYPEAGLEKIRFVCGGSGWSMGYNEDGQPDIGCPYKESFSASDEHSLMHEVGHVKNHKSWALLFKNAKPTRLLTLGVVSTNILAGAGIGYRLMQTCSGTNNKMAIVGLSAVSVYGLSRLSKKIMKPILQRLDETWADQYALRHADKEALVGGFYKYKKHGYQQSLWYRNFLDRWKHDFAHPASNDRAKKIEKTLLKKFKFSIPQVDLSAIEYAG